MDLFRKSKSLYASTTNTFSTGDEETITPASVAGLPTDTEITLTFDRVDSSGTATPTKMERIIGTISGGNFVTRADTGRGADGTTEQAHTSPVVEYILNAKDWNDLIDAQLTHFNQDGTFIDSSWTDLDYAAEVSIDGDNGPKQRITLTGNVEFTFDNMPDGRVFMLRITQDEGGENTVTFPATGITWLSPTTDVDETGDATTVYGFIQTGEDTYDGWLMGKEY